MNALDRSFCGLCYCSIVIGLQCFVCQHASITAFNFIHRCAFLHFCSVKRPKLKQENPSLSVGAMARQLSSAWKLMTPEQKKPYNEMAERDKQRLVEMCACFLSLWISPPPPPLALFLSSLPLSFYSSILPLFFPCFSVHHTEGISPSVCVRVWSCPQMAGICVQNSRSGGEWCTGSLAEHGTELITSLRRQTVSGTWTW